jgi:uncharacterized protein (TIGR00725 family)
MVFMRAEKIRTAGKKAHIGVIGDGGVRRGTKSFRLAKDLGRALVDSGFRVVSGGLGGVMLAACEGAHASRHYHVGDTIGILPGSDPSVANPFVDIAIPTGLEHVRNSIVAHSDAIIAIGGGAGTLSEICFAWIYKRLIIAVGEEGWAGKLAGKPLDHRVRFGGRIRGDRIHAARSAEEALKLIYRLLPQYSQYGRKIASGLPGKH